MKKFIVTLFVILLTASLSYAGQIVLNYPDAEQARILDGITKDGGNCQEGEAKGPCAKRLLVAMIKNEVKTWSDYKAKKAAVDAVVATEEPAVS